MAGPERITVASVLRMVASCVGMSSPNETRAFGNAATRLQEFVVKAFLMEIQHMRKPDEDNRKPTWFTPEEARKRLAKGREVKYLRELEAVIDRALERIQFHHELWGAYPGSREARPTAKDPLAASIWP